VFSFNLVGVAIIFRVQQFQIRRQIKYQIMQGVPDDELRAIHVSKTNASELFWVEDHEFFYRGAMYDVVRKTVLSDTETVYYCINDILEKKLLTHLETLVKDQKSGNGPLGTLVKKLYQFLSGLYYTDRDTASFPSSRITSILSWHFFTAYRSVFLSIPSPPPQVTHQHIHC
jgi:hypothetical protein